MIHAHEGVHAQVQGPALFLGRSVSGVVDEDLAGLGRAPGFNGGQAQAEAGPQGESLSKVLGHQKYLEAGPVLVSKETPCGEAGTRRYCRWCGRG